MLIFQFQLFNKLDKGTKKEDWDASIWKFEVKDGFWAFVFKTDRIFYWKYQ